MLSSILVYLKYNCHLTLFLHKEICQNPKFFSNGADRHDVAQGSLQNCWFVSALATLSQYKSLLYRVCPPHQTFRKDHYCGLFVFRFWRFGEWIEVIVDDRLPTQNGRLYFAKSTDPTEFWCCLLEKAYCK
jgi:calpain